MVEYGEAIEYFCVCVCVVVCVSVSKNLEKLWDWSRSIGRTRDWSAAGVEPGESGERCCVVDDGCWLFVDIVS